MHRIIHCIRFCHQIDDLNSVKRIYPRAALFLLAVHVRLSLDLQDSPKRLVYGSGSINLHIIMCQCWDKTLRISKKSLFLNKKMLKVGLCLLGDMVRKCLEPPQSNPTRNIPERKRKTTSVVAMHLGN